MECGIQQQELQIVKSIMALRFCKSKHPAAQHDFSWRRHSPNNQPLYSASHQTVSTVNKHRIWWKGPPSMISHKKCLTPTNVAGMSQMTWPNNPYKLPE
jgi:hypothetical protein